jgi:hypothetical protein
VWFFPPSPHLILLGLIILKMLIKQ